jgi:hypothetical protein
MVHGGAEGARTPDLMHAMHALFQLSYSPERLLTENRYYHSIMVMSIVFGLSPADLLIFMLTNRNNENILS